MTAPVAGGRADATRHPGGRVRDDRRERARRRHPARTRRRVPNAVVADLESTRVRLIGLDTPEISPALECWGGEATARLTALLPRARRCGRRADREVLDQYGRHLLYLWTHDGRFVNAELVAEGDGTVMVFAPNTLHDRFPRARGRGLGRGPRACWGAC